MCDKCQVVDKLFALAETEPHQNYVPAFSFIRAMVKQNRIGYFAGDCLLGDMEQLLDSEAHYTICHFFRCMNCRQFFLIAVCMRGKPIFRSVDDLSAEYLERLLWGRCGSFYEQDGQTAHND